MENLALTIKYIEFLALELSVIVVVGIVVGAGVYQIVRDKVREARRSDQVALELS